LGRPSAGAAFGGIQPALAATQGDVALHSRIEVEDSG
jgi:hypothetical protein